MGRQGGGEAVGSPRTAATCVSQPLMRQASPVVSASCSASDALNSVAYGRSRIAAARGSPCRTAAQALDRMLGALGIGGAVCLSAAGRRRQRIALRVENGLQRGDGVGSSGRHAFRGSAPGIDREHRPARRRTATGRWAARADSNASAPALASRRPLATSNFADECIGTAHDLGDIDAGIFSQARQACLELVVYPHQVLAAGESRLVDQRLQRHRDRFEGGKPERPGLIGDGLDVEAGHARPSATLATSAAATTLRKPVSAGPASRGAATPSEGGPRTAATAPGQPRSRRLDRHRLRRRRRRPRDGRGQQSARVPGRRASPRSTHSAPAPRANAPILGPTFSGVGADHGDALRVARAPPRVRPTWVSIGMDCLSAIAIAAAAHRVALRSGACLRPAEGR